jgi:hypothetical protein
LISGTYTINFFKITDSKEYTLDKSVNTKCYGSIVKKDNFLVCANKNSKKLEIYPIQTNQLIGDAYLKFTKGWSLKALPVDKEINASTFSDAKFLWKYNKGWKVWSPNKQLLQKLQKSGIEIFDTIKSGEGFWAYYENEKVKAFNGKEYGFEKIDIHPGWNLVGIGRDLKIDTISTSNMKYIWKYNDGEWYIWTKDSSELLDRFNFPTFQNLKRGEGFWVFGK